MNRELADQLVALKQEDERVRAKLVADGTLFDGYNKVMEGIHVKNAAELEAIIEEHGWPTTSLVGDEGAEAAFIIAMHAISRPLFQVKCLELIRAAVAEEDYPIKYEAYLTDRICFNRRQPQVFGTIFDWDENGELSPWFIDDPKHIEARRTAVGFAPLAESVPKQRDQARREGNKPPQDFAARQKEIEDWARKVGWI